MKRWIAIILALLLMLPSGITAMAADTAITSVNLPVSETDFWTNAAIESPQFYSSLECVVNNKTVTLDGFTWKCDNYASDTAGTYVFSAVAPSGYTFACDVPAITVNMKSGGGYHHAAYYMGRDYMGQNIAVVNNIFSDRTGFNALLSGEIGTGLGLVAGIDYKKTMSKADSANILLENTTLTYVFAGSFGTNYIGTSDIYVNGGEITGGLFAGSVNGTYDGTTNIYISGSPTIKLLSCGGYYDVNAKTSGNGTTVGSTTTTYNGTVNIHIAEDFAGNIGNINFADADTINLYIASGAEFNLSKYQVSKKNVNVYIDGVSRDVVSHVEYNGADFVVGTPGTAEANVITDSITVHSKDSKVVLSGITWESDDYSANKSGVYTFTPVLPAKYILADDVKLPSVDVLVAQSGEATVSTVSYENETVIPDGIDLYALDMPDTVSATFDLNGTSYTYDIPAIFTTQNYSSDAGTYSFALSLDDVFAASSLPSLKVTVSREASVKKSGDVFEINSAPVRFSGEERKNYTITDIAGIYTYYDKVEIINAVYAKGTGVEIAIDSDVVRIENKIDLNGTSGTVVLDIPVALVTRVRYASSIAENVYINGVQMSDYTGKTATITSSKSYIYANGVPSVIAFGEDGGTYLYRANDMSLLYSGDITGWSVRAGSKTGTTARTNIALMSGSVYVLYAGGDAFVDDATVVLDGGSADYLRGGGPSGSSTLHTTVVLESGYHKEYIMGGAASGGVVGDSTKTYADDEYSLEMHIFGGAYTTVYLGGSGNTYGNINLLQYGSKVGAFNSSGAGTVSGNIDITVYGGLWEGTYTTQNVTGETRMRLYKGLLNDDHRVYPRIACDNLKITYFGDYGNFEFTEYIHNRDAVISSDGDAGKLVIRFLETKYLGEEKNKNRYFDSIGDCIYITFPNGQNMLVDTGEENSHELTLATLKELGVTKLDYFLITHNHGDHVGAADKIAKAFPVDTFIMQDQVTPYSVVTNAIAVNNSTVLKANRYDYMMIGDVELYALNPTEPIQSHENTASMATLLTYGDSKILLGADTYLATEKSWLADEIIAPKIKDCDLVKLGHHGYPSSSGYSYIEHVNPDFVAITTPREYNGYLDAMVFQLTDINGINHDNIYVTGRQGLTKFTFDGTDNGETIECEYIKVAPNYADYDAVYDVIDAYNAYDEALSETDIAKWEEALSLVEYNLPLEDQRIVDGAAAHLDAVFRSITSDKTITATNLAGYTMKTVFPYSNPSDSKYWSSILTYVQLPAFYPTIPATVGGVETELEVTWECTDSTGKAVAYDGTAIGTTYYFRASAGDYHWKCDIPVIEVTIVDAGLSSKSVRHGFVSNGTPVPYLIKGNTEGKNEIYDVTGCNKLLPDKSFGTTFENMAGMFNTVASAGGKTLPDASEGETSVTVTGGANFAEVYGGGHGKTHNGNTKVFVNNATVNYVYGGGYNADVIGNTNVDVSGQVAIKEIIGGSSHSQTVSGTAYVTVHDLSETSTVSKISKGTAAKLVVNLDDTSEHILTSGAVNGAATDANVEVYVNGKRFMGVIADELLSGIPESVMTGTAGDNLPTTFGEISGFVWSGDDTKLGEQTFTLTAPEGYYFSGYTKTKAYTVTVTEKVVPVTQVTLDKTAVTLTEGETVMLTATVEPDDATDPIVTWTAEGNVTLSTTTGNTVTVTAVGESAATVTATAGGVSASCAVTVNAKPVVTDVDTDGLVMNTVFPYNDNANEAYWYTYVSNVTDPTFYPELTVTVNGQKVTLPVSWVCTTEYDSTAIGATYIFRPVADGYVFADGVGEITVKIADAGLNTPSTRVFAFCSAGDIVPTVAKNGDGLRTVFYDATGCNVIYTGINVNDRTDLDFNYLAGVGNKAGTGKTPAESATGDTKLTLDGTTNLTRVFGGSHGIPHTGNTYIYADNTTFVVRKSKVAGIYGGSYAGELSGNTYIYITGTSVIPNVFGGGNAGNVTGDTNIDISGTATITNVYGGGYGTAGTVSGTAYVNIHNLDATSSITNISRGTASKLVVNLDDTSADLVSVITDVDTDENIKVYINGKLYGEPEAEAIVLTDSMVNYRLRCTTTVIDGNLVLTADPAGTSSMKVRLGNLPEGATLEFVETNANASMASGIITVTNPGMKNVNVPMVITSADGLKTEFVLVADFENAIRYATYARLSQTGNNITVTSGAATAYVLFDTTDIDGGYVEVENVSRNLLGRYVVSGSAVRFYNPVYDNGTVTVNIKNADGETVETYNVTAVFADATEYTPVLESSLRCTYTIDGDNITVNAIVGATNVYLNFGRYYAETLTASVNDDLVKKMGARSWRIMRTEIPVEFDVYFDATAYGADTVTRHVTVKF